MTTDSPFATGPYVAVEETFTPSTVFRLRDHLAATLEHHADVAPDGAIAAAEALLAADLINLPTLRRTALAADTPVLCENASCDGPKQHDHGTDCGPLCPCGEGA